VGALARGPARALHPPAGGPGDARLLLRLPVLHLLLRLLPAAGMPVVVWAVWEEAQVSDVLAAGRGPGARVAAPR